MIHNRSFNGLSKKNLLMRQILDKLEAILDSTPYDSDEITMLLDCLKVKYA